jgi:Superinfection immunity protein
MEIMESMNKTSLILLTALALLAIEFTSQAQGSSPIAIKITKDQWSETTNTLDVYGLGTNPDAVAVKFVGFDKNQHFVIESRDYTFNPDGTFHVVLSDAKKEIRFVQVVNMPPAVVRANTPSVAATPRAEMSASPRTVTVSTPRVLTPAEIAKINNSSLGNSPPVPVNTSGYFGISFAVLLLMIGLAIVVYFIPVMIAVARRHRKVTSIFLVNLFFGWSILGWIFALVWALRANVPPEAVSMPSTLPTTTSPASVN